MWGVLMLEAAMDIKAGVPFHKLLALRASKYVSSHNENLALQSCSLCPTAELPINQISSPGLLVWHSVEYNVAKAGIPVQSLGFQVRIHHS